MPCLSGGSCVRSNCWQQLAAAAVTHQAFMPGNNNNVQAQTHTQTQRAYTPPHASHDSTKPIWAPTFSLTQLVAHRQTHILSLPLYFCRTLRVVILARTQQHTFCCRRFSYCCCCCYCCCCPFAIINAISSVSCAECEPWHSGTRSEKPQKQQQKQLIHCISMYGVCMSVCLYVCMYVFANVADQQATR